MKLRQWIRVAATASAIGLAGPVIANDIGTAGTGSDASPSTSFDTQSSMDNAVNTSPETSAASRSSNGAINGAVDGSVKGATQGGAMTSPQQLGESPTERGDQGDTKSANFDQWMSDYAAAHEGRITRDQFLDQMGRRFDAADTSNRGYLMQDQLHGVLQ